MSAVSPLKTHTANFLSEYDTQEEPYFNPLPVTENCQCALLNGKKICFNISQSREALKVKSVPVNCIKLGVIWFQRKTDGGIVHIMSWNILTTASHNFKRTVKISVKIYLKCQMIKKLQTINDLHQFL